MVGNQPSQDRFNYKIEGGPVKIFDFVKNLVGQEEKMKIVKDEQTRLYELTYLVPAVFTQTEIVKIREEISALLKKYQGEIIKTDDWGKKPLAYAIRHNSKDVTEAFFTFVEFKLLPAKAPSFEREIFLMSNLIRHLMVRADEKPAKKVVAKVATKKEETK